MTITIAETQPHTMLAVHHYQSCSRSCQHSGMTPGNGAGACGQKA